MKTNRIIKFRGKRIDTDVWIYGSFHLHKDIMLCLASKEQIENNLKALIITDGMADWNLPVPINTYEVILKTVGQFTGLKDSKGKEIFEGDIVNGCCFNASYAYGIVKQFQIGWIVEPIGRFIEGYDDINTLGIEIVGNIFDNKELLNNLN